MITKFGKPVAQISPLEEKPAARQWLGSMAGTARIIGDIIEPVVPIEDYDAFKYPYAFKDD